MASSEVILSALRKLEDSLVQRLGAEMDQRLGEFRLEVNGRFDAIEVRLDRLETEYQMIVAALRRIEETPTADRSDRARLRTEVVELRNKVAQLDARVRELETKLAEE